MLTLLARLVLGHQIWIVVPERRLIDASPPLIRIGRSGLNERREKLGQCVLLPLVR